VVVKRHEVSTSINKNKQVQRYNLHEQEQIHH